MIHVTKVRIRPPGGTPLLPKDETGSRGGAGRAAVHGLDSTCKEPTRVPHENVDALLVLAVCWCSRQDDFRHRHRAGLRPQRVFLGRASPQMLVGEIMEHNVVCVASGQVPSTLPLPSSAPAVDEIASTGPFIPRSQLTDLVNALRQALWKQEGR
jgi:hypothetical protein